MEALQAVDSQRVSSIEVENGDQRHLSQMAGVEEMSTRARGHP